MPLACSRLYSAGLLSIVGCGPRPLAAITGLLVWLAPVVSGCGTLRITTAHDPTAPFAAYTTYEWAEAQPIPHLRRSPQARAQLDAMIRRAVEWQLAAKGYTRSPRQPDFLVSYSIATKEKTAETFTDYYRYLQSGGRASVQEAYVEGYEEGTLILEIADAQRQRCVWRATATAALTTKNEEERLNEAIARMMQHFPPVAP